MNQHSNPFAFAFQSSNASMFQEQIGAHMAEARKLEPKRATESVQTKDKAGDLHMSPGQMRVYGSLISGGPGHCGELSERIGTMPDVIVRQMVTALHHMGKARVKKKIRIGNKSWKIWEAVA